MVSLYKIKSHIKPCRIILKQKMAKLKGVEATFVNIIMKRITNPFLVCHSYDLRIKLRNLSSNFNDLQANLIITPYSLRCDS